jgi:PKD repeat protein
MHMTRTAPTVSTVAAALFAVLAMSGGCTMKGQDTPPLAGPSEFGTSITLTANPDAINQDGGSQSLITITARDSNGKPKSGLSLRTDIYVGGEHTDFGALSARSVATDANGHATLVYTAPASPAGPAVDTGTLVSIVATPLGTPGDYLNEASRLVTIRLLPVGVVVPPDGLQPYFTFTPTAPADHQNVLFDACNDPQRPPCAPSSNPIASFSWDFGDGQIGSGRQATHAFSTAGTYFVKLTITDGVGRSASTTQTVIVGQGAAPVAAFTTSPGNPQVNQAVNFNASASAATAGRRIVSYAWDFGDGDQKTNASATTTHDFLTAGVFQVTLTVTDDAGHTGSVTNPVTVGTFSTPTAAFTRSPAAPAVNEQIFFNASASKAATGRSIVSYGWDFGDGAGGGGVTPSHAYALAGSYTVTLTVTDDVGQKGITSQSVAVGQPGSPIAAFTISPTDPVVLDSVNFNASSSTPSTGRTIVNYVWDFGDGTGASGVQVNHPYTVARTYTITLTVTDDAGRTGTTTKTLVIKP